MYKPTYLKFDWRKEEERDQRLLCFIKLEF